MFKTSQRFHISSLCFLAITVFSLSSRAAQPADTRERRVEGRRWWEMIGGRSGDSLTHKEALRFSGSSRHPARLHPVCHQASMVLSRPEWLALLSFGFCTSCVAATHGRSRSCWLFILASFAPSPFSSSPLLHPSCLPLSLNPGSPHPDRRSNSLSTAASKWFHPPSPLSSPANDVPRSIILWCWLPQSSGCVCVCVCVCVLGVGGGGCRGSCLSSLWGAKIEGGKKKERWVVAQAFLLHVLSSVLPRDPRAAFLRLLLSNDYVSDAISRMLLRRCQPRWHPTNNSSPFYCSKLR